MMLRPTHSWCMCVCVGGGGGGGGCRDNSPVIMKLKTCMHESLKFKRVKVLHLGLGRCVFFGPLAPFGYTTGKVTRKQLVKQNKLN